MYLTLSFLASLFQSEVVCRNEVLVNISYQMQMLGRSSWGFVRESLSSPKLVLVLVLLPSLSLRHLFPEAAHLRHLLCPALCGVLFQVPEQRNGYVFPSALTGGLWRKGWEHNLMNLLKCNSTRRYIHLHIYICIHTYVYVHIYEGLYIYVSETSEELCFQNPLGIMIFFTNVEETR